MYFFVRVCEIRAVVSQNVTNQSCFVCDVSREKTKHTRSPSDPMGARSKAKLTYVHFVIMQGEAE